MTQPQLIRSNTLALNTHSVTSPGSVESGGKSLKVSHSCFRTVVLILLSSGIRRRIPHTASHSDAEHDPAAAQASRVNIENRKYRSLNFRLLLMKL